MIRKLGPGKYDNHKLDFVKALAEKPTSSLGVCSTRERRFRKKYTVMFQFFFLVLFVELLNVILYDAQNTGVS